MDPYLEAPEYWPGVHHALITFIWMHLNARLPKRYWANIGERLVVVEEERDIFPDAFVKERPESQRSQGASAAATITETRSDPAVRVPLAPETISEAYVEIQLAKSEGQVVTVIEVLSPTNKSPRSDGRQQYQTKQSSLLQSSVHLLEIDLLRGGTYTVAAPRNRLPRRSRWDYVTSLHRAGDPECDVWLVSLQQRLPRVDVPLLDADPGLVLDVQEMVNQCYDVGNYADHIDYRRDPVVPFSPADAKWASAQLRKRGLRP
jgi:hypothetical protein